MLLLALLLTACQGRANAPQAAPGPLPILSFSAVLDQQIREAMQQARPTIEAAAAHDPNAEAWQRCDFATVLNDTLHFDPAEHTDLRTAPFGQWSPWLTDYCLLHEFLVDSTSLAKAGEGTYARPVRLPTRTGRQLYLAGTELLVLLEFRPGAFRGMALAAHNTFGGLTHHFYPHPEAELLVLTAVRGDMGAGRGASGEAITDLQVYDLRHNQWLLNTPVGRYETHFGYTNDNGEDSPSEELDVQRQYKVLDRGRTIWLGAYTVQGNAPDTARVQPQLPPDLLGDAADTTGQLPAGTYRLQQGQYRRVGD
ncbi:hypothetical protein F0P96_01185 [Hymenobacter busanensis]|uniref:Uncharacterized protein n=1 Tax=Hymenobacter busanensis TaxID=2607656 RepID=A0A7L4ZZR5_9BACT|nr:hypothetical protein [Hymenobacter busanensis]KAA9339268.1 hypothetical protein F0P96_01185 [Hymenobacter busanensis]QHJ06970.1 hypothetical protein GUY19_06565 [Hymenobacter busanensis]